jgi:4-amino-4-deoxy-L-arabinose transferase-like glycosyltransferase
LTTEGQSRLGRYSTLIVFLAALAALFALRGRALSTPYFWDEVGYYVPAAVSMYRNHLYPIPDLTTPLGYPPLQPLSLVVAWWIFGFSIAAARIACFVAAAAAVAATYALGREVFSTAAGVAAAALTLASPVFFGQAGFAQPECLLALFTTAATLALVRGRYGAHATAVALLLVTKWTALVSLPAFGLYALATARTWREGLARQLWYAPGLVLLAAWFGFFYHETGAFGPHQADWTKVNLWDNLGPAVLLSRAAVRVEQLVEYDFAWLVLAPALLAGAAWCWRRSRGLERDSATAGRVALMAGVGALYVAFLTVSGFLLPRYFVPVEPLFAVAGAAGIFYLAPRPLAVGYVAAAALLIHLNWYGRMAGGPALLETRAAYYDFVDTHAHASRWIEANMPGARVAATWPAFDELRYPFLGYVSRPVETVRLDALPEGAEALDRFDVLYDAPVPGNPNPAREAALRLGLVEAARFDVDGQSVILWTPPHGTGSGRDRGGPEP